MKITILTLFPEMFEGFLTTSIIKKARLKGLAEIEAIDIREFTDDKHNRVDEYPFGAVRGMIVKCQPVLDLSEKRPDAPKPGAADGTDGSAVYSGQGPRVGKTGSPDSFVRSLQGFDARIRAYVDEEISIGDYVLTGGELASMVIADAVTRLVPGVITEESHLDESFENGLLEYPLYPAGGL